MNSEKHVCDSESSSTHMMSCVSESDWLETSPWPHGEMKISKASGFPLHVAEIKSYGWEKWNGKSNKQHKQMTLTKRELHYAWACSIPLQHKLHVIVFALNHGAEKLASYLSL